MAHPAAPARLISADAEPLPEVSAAALARLVEIVSIRPPPEAFALHRRGPAANTILGVVAADASLTKAQCTRVAMVAQNGYARAHGSRPHRGRRRSWQASPMANA